jgi:hypothetical protein
VSTPAPIVGNCARCPDKGVPVALCATCSRWLCAPCLAAHKDQAAPPTIWVGPPEGP